MRSNSASELKPREELKAPPKHRECCPTCGRRVGLKLMLRDVRIIKKKLALGANISSLAKEYDVTRQAIRRIQRGLIWKDI